VYGVWKCLAVYQTVRWRAGMPSHVTPMLPPPFTSLLAPLYQWLLQTVGESGLRTPLLSRTEIPPSSIAYMPYYIDYPSVPAVPSNPEHMMPRSRPTHIEPEQAQHVLPIRCTCSPTLTMRSRMLTPTLVGETVPLLPHLLHTYSLASMILF
jgi:hypothetical protein